VRPSLPALLAFAAAAVLALLLLIAAGQPLATDDTWLHLSLGRAYAQAGPWLDTDPLLASAPGPPTPAAWLFDVMLYGVERAMGFAGLRVLHVALVATIVAVGFSLLQRASKSLLVASFASATFVVLAAYRLVQLRPHLLTMLAALVLYRGLLDRDARPSRLAFVWVALLFAIWANVHAAFLLGPLLIGAAIAGLVVGMPLRTSDDRAPDLSRVVHLAIAGALGTLATFANPAGAAPHLAWWIAGRDTPALGRVADEWARIDPFALPLPGLPPSPLSWALLWALMLATVLAVVIAVRSWRPGHREHLEADATTARVDPALVGVALLSIALSLVAVRFLWLVIFPLLLIAQASRGWPALRGARASAVRWAAAAATCLLVPAFLRLGAWPMVTAALPASWAGYRQPYHAGKYHADLVWVLADAGLAGTAFTDYHMAGFTGYQLAPRVRTLVNGTLNVPPDVIAANLPLRLRRGERPGERFVELLDRHEVDLFVGIRLPRRAPTARPWFHTTAHLEHTPGWIPVFRNLTGAIYLRDLPRNRSNLERMATWYAEQGIPFDRETGFDPAAAVRADRAWAMQRGIVPLHFDTVAQTAFGPDPEQRTRARDLLASIYAALGLYERAIGLDRPRVASDPEAWAARRRLVWSLLRLRRLDEALAVAAPLAERPERYRLSHQIAETARRVAASDDEEAIAQAIATLPVFTNAEVAALTAHLVRPGPRVPAR